MVTGAKSAGYFYYAPQPALLYCSSRKILLF
jgi:hypothetical protein